MTELVAGNLELGLAPEVGGSVAYFRLRDGSRVVDLMRPLDEAARRRRDPIGVAMFPMVPYANRIADNLFSFRGRDYRFTANNPPERFNVHGTAWHQPWTVHADGPGRVSLELIHEDPGGAPYSYLARQLFDLAPDRLTVTMLVENRGREVMPFGFGEHPWFDRDPDVEVRYSAASVWLEGPDGVATERIATPPELGFAGWKRLPPARRNLCYGGWDGRLDIRWPGRGVALHIKADPIYRHLMVYCDPARPTFCLEPQTNATGALNRIADGTPDPDLGVILLEPGASASGAMTFRPQRV